MSNSFYIKVACQGKIKKYAVKDVLRVDFNQIKNQFILNKNAKESILHYQIVEDFASSESRHKNQFTEDGIIQYLKEYRPEHGRTIKLRIIQRELMSEQERRRKESTNSLQIPDYFEKKRSRSEEINTDLFDQTCKTEVFFVDEDLGQNAGLKDCKLIDKNVLLSQIEGNINKLNDVKQNSSVSPKKHKKKSLTKSTEVQSTIQTSIQNSNTQTNENLFGSFTRSLQFQKIQNCLHQSIRITERQKSELEKLKNKIKLKQKQLLKTQAQQIDAQEILGILDLKY